MAAWLNGLVLDAGDRRMLEEANARAEEDILCLWAVHTLESESKCGRCDCIPSHSLSSLFVGRGFL